MLSDQFLSSGSVLRAHRQHGVTAGERLADSLERLLGVGNINDAERPSWR
jgi:hypothetical protein